MPADYTQGPEALEWLRSNPSESALASKRFGETREAIRFVQQLYTAGAKRVIVPLAAIRSDEAETYADSLVVTLPAKPAGAQRVREICAEEIRREGGAASDAVQNPVLLWWD